MFMMHVSRQDNPFEHNVKVGCAAMQKIWDALFKAPHRIIQSSAVYQLTMQRVLDSWCSTMGSMAVAIVLAFCNANSDLKNSDENRQEFAVQYLKHLRFLYHKADGDDAKKFKGAFRGPFILQTFASHLTTVKGAQKIHGIDDSQPYGALAIATAAVEHALKLIASGIITIEMVKKAKGRIPTLLKQINQATGKVSNQFTVFNEASWGKRCSSYVKLAKNLSASRFNKIITLSAEYMKISQNLEDEDVIEIPDDDDDDIRANIVDHSSSGEDD
ncbi:hypothetical protein L208DRAFT_1399990 [Tricholoma matsutake]|nr:hypothetical protein L208DRAFT_1399990 [Tricholoma matsutake 945]